MDRIIHKQSVNCKYCASTNIVRYGTFQGMQRYFCKNCRRKFADNDALPGMKTPVWIISLALNCYYRGMSLGAIQQEINRRHGAYYAQSSIYNWIIRFSTAAAGQAQTFQLEAGDKLFFAVTPAAKGRNPLYFLDVFDLHRKSLLASQLQENITPSAVSKLIRSIEFDAVPTSRHTVTILLAPELADFKSELIGSDPGLAAGIFIQEADAAVVKEFAVLLKKRRRVVHNFRDISRAQILLSAWRMHYNFLNNKVKPKLKMPYGESNGSGVRSWDDIISQSRSIR